MMDEENRGASKPVPEKLDGVLNELQNITPVVSNAEGTTIGVLDEDGRVNLEHDDRLRR